MKLKKLLKHVPHVLVKGSKEIEITGLTANSKLVAPGNLFIAKKGLHHDGSRFIPDAVAAGASAILTTMYDPFFPDMIQLIHPDVSCIEAELARQFYGFSDEKLFLVGITGTNGKTTTAYLIKYMLDHLGSSCGLIGTIEWIVDKHVLPSSQTTPDVITNYKLFSEMTDACVMEVSSHALDQERVRSIEFDVAVFTNLTQDHLDYHQTMIRYADAKRKLFSSLLPSSLARKSKHAKYAVINQDSPWSQHMVEQCRVSILTYSIDSPSDLRAENVVLTSLGMQLTLCYRGERYPFQSPLTGRFNVYNVLAAIGVGIVKGLSIETILSVLQNFRGVPGRLERIDNARGLSIFVDYAHTDDALKNVLQSLRELSFGKIITVFGCGGNRDAYKRPKMGAVAEEYSDVSIITTDNPRYEDPHEIIAEIVAGFKDPQKAIVIADREEAIDRAIEMAHAEDAVLIAGKGHEAYQIFANHTLDFDDRLIAAKACLLF